MTTFVSTLPGRARAEPLLGEDLQEMGRKRVACGGV